MGNITIEENATRHLEVSCANCFRVFVCCFSLLCCQQLAWRIFYQHVRLVCVCILQECETLNPKPQPSFCAIWTIFSLICAGSEGDFALGLGFLIFPWNARQCPQKKGDVIQGAHHLLRHHRQLPGKNMSKTGILVVHLILILLSATSAWTISVHPYIRSIFQ